MSVNTVETKGMLNTKNFIKNVVSDYLNKCILCHRCMDACPVTKGQFSIQELNQAIQGDRPVPSVIKEFVFHCTQCGKCVPVCPVNIRRDYMVRSLKAKLRYQRPWSYRRYLLIKGPDLKGIQRFIQKLYIAFKKITTKDLACFMETTPLKKADVLFYPGCYIYSKKTVRQTLRLLDHLSCSYSVLGGVTACCGQPHLLQGEFDEADYCLKLLHGKIKTVSPNIVLTSCAECFEAVEQIKKIFNEDFEILSVVQYLVRYKEKLPTGKIRGKLTIHDSCRFKKESPQGLAARITAQMFGELVEQTTSEESSCCFQWNHGQDPFNGSRRKIYLTGVKKNAPTLVCNCLTCYEELKKIHTDVEIIDVLQLFEEAVDALQSRNGTL
ncbi:hypothetical protein AYK25_07895 [Thermoplasmatales archaeon SM1-50]|nr:MAG: hypothetical protein AYK25_07895 [Thermoplasmatales archaeon SM1-50]